MWWERVGAKIASEAVAPHDNSRDPDRRLVLGYVSSDFNAHSAALIFKPVLQHHDRTQFHITVYASPIRADDAFARMRRLADTWQPITRLSDAQLAETIRADEVDILADLSGHTPGNPLAAFAPKPAPTPTRATSRSHPGMGRSRAMR